MSIHVNALWNILEEARSGMCSLPMLSFSRIGHHVRPCAPESTNEHKDYLPMAFIAPKQLDLAFVPKGTPMFSDLITKLEADRELSDTRRRDMISGLRRVANLRPGRQALHRNAARHGIGHRRLAAPEPLPRGGIVTDRASTALKHLQIAVVEPVAMAERDVITQETDAVEMFHCRGAKAFTRILRLPLGLNQMHVDLRTGVFCRASNGLQQCVRTPVQVGRRIIDPQAIPPPARLLSQNPT